jgi:hypothetical protein
MFDDSNIIAGLEIGTSKIAWLWVNRARTAR